MYSLLTERGVEAYIIVPSLHTCARVVCCRHLNLAIYGLFLSRRNKLDTVQVPINMVDLPLGATEDRVCGTIDIEKALTGRPSPQNHEHLNSSTVWCSLFLFGSKRRRGSSTALVTEGTKAFEPGLLAKESRLATRFPADIPSPVAFHEVCVQLHSVLDFCCLRQTAEFSTLMRSTCSMTTSSMSFSILRYVLFVISAIDS
jgi:hypothetical protein